MALLRIGLEGFDSFSSSPSWIASVTGSKLCSHCYNVLPDVQGVAAIVRNIDRKTDVDNIAVRCGRVHVLSRKFINTVGGKLVESVAYLGEVSDENGEESSYHVTAVARSDNVVLRGSELSQPGLCKVCGRLLYWPIGKKYVVASELPKDHLFLSDGNIFCTLSFYLEKLVPAKLYRILPEEIPVVSDPLDGLPKEVAGIKEALRKLGRYK